MLIRLECVLMNAYEGGSGGMHPQKIIALKSILRPCFDRNITIQFYRSKEGLIDKFPVVRNCCHCILINDLTYDHVSSLVFKART